LLELTMKQETLGYSIGEVFDLLASVYADLEAFAATLTQRLAAADWNDCYPVKISQWKYERDYYALYSPKTVANAKTLEYAVMVQLRLANTDFSQEPLLLAAAISFGRLIPVADAWGPWTKGGGHDVMQYLLREGNGVEIPRDVFKNGFAPAGKRAFGLAIPLCSLQDSNEVQIRVIEPVLVCAANVGYKAKSGKR
ncbi:MAG: hypothetical protein ACREJC_16645, partial [Tepidisphaeraceae bacterium]